MKGLMNMGPYMFIMIFMIAGVTVLLYGVASNTIEFNTKVVESSISKSNVMDTTKLVKACLENSLSKLQECRQKEGAVFVNVVDLETGKSFSSGSERNEKETHRLYLNILEGDEIHLGRLYVKV